jgi:hypothetical protein
MTQMTFFVFWAVGCATRSDAAARVSASSFI